ncbi:MAG: hypothetical protein FWE71_05880 [Nocardioidaceae bacterium]|nr:hypothetical protein [Nocardioidaceae bacterium]MCL2613038.1 hypothetical protein [Nocardioidaceae bacterium]
MPKLDLPKIEFRKIDLPKVDIRAIEVPAVAEKPIYAGVGAVDLAYASVKVYVTDAQTKAQARIADVQKVVKGFELPEPKSLQDRAAASYAGSKTKAQARIADLQADARALPAKVQSQVKSTVDGNVATVTATYADLAKRGEAVVVKLRNGDAPAPAKKAAPAKKSSAVKKAPAKKAPAKKAPAKKATTAKKTTAKKAPAKKA